MPAILEANGAAWTAIWVDHVENGTPISNVAKGRYRHEAIKAAIVAETHTKCAYCESKITHVYHGDVEHIRPKSRCPDLFVAWENLTLGCAICNGFKGDYYSEEEPLLNPYQDAPSEHIRFHGPVAFHIPGSELGERTALRLNLSRPALCERRAEGIQSIKALIDRWAAQPPGELKDLLLRKIQEQLGDETEYAGALCAFASDHAGIEI